MLTLLYKGGPLMVPLLGCSLIAVALIIERFWHFKRAQIDSLGLLKEIENTLDDNAYEKAIKQCEESPGPVAAVLREVLINHERPVSSLKEAVETVAMVEVPRLRRYTMVLAIIATISPLLGLLGTVTGMIKAFMTIQQESGVVNPALLAGGIWEALITTVAGLAVAIPTHMFYQMFNSVINQFINEMERTTTELINYITAKKDRMTNAV